MVFRLSKIITKTGDQGKTHIGKGVQVSKDSSRVMAIGDIDELNSTIGLLRVYVEDQAIKDNLIRIQHHLLISGSYLAGSGRSELTPAHVVFLESWAADLMQLLEPVQDFVLPGGSIAGAHCHICRVTCRRAERHVVACANETELATLVMQYLNRLSDVLFVLARVLNKQANVDEIVLQRDMV
ncbi:cob(I)yrinic acid a,c-diamide adenosyltransferase [Neisseria sp. Ec49-e6-T10]|uniref:cob(I)yrinic acid a,c-diamide adenosyltransferase n=1 Tax=Neisseria sp. Ec49-e6-T10 TaxID=3140744 RepID=UPI003EBA4BC5